MSRWFYLWKIKNKANRDWQRDEIISSLNLGSLKYLKVNNFPKERGLYISKEKSGRMKFFGLKRWNLTLWLCLIRVQPVLNNCIGSTRAGRMSSGIQEPWMVTEALEWKHLELNRPGIGELKAFNIRCENWKTHALELCAPLKYPLPFAPNRR